MYIDVPARNNPKIKLRKQVFTHTIKKVCLEIYLTVVKKKMYTQNHTNFVRSSSH